MQHSLHHLPEPFGVRATRTSISPLALRGCMAFRTKSGLRPALHLRCKNSDSQSQGGHPERGGRQTFGCWPSSRTEVTLIAWPAFTIMIHPQFGGICNPRWHDWLGWPTPHLTSPLSGERNLDAGYCQKNSPPLPNCRGREMMSVRLNRRLTAENLTWPWEPPACRRSPFRRSASRSTRWSAHVPRDRMPGRWG